MRRSGYVLIAVLIVIVVLSLVAYRFTDAMSADYRASVRTADMAQARVAAVSGIHYAAALLADPESRASLLGSTLNNPGLFDQIPVRTDPNSVNRNAYFSIVAFAPLGTAPSGRSGITDEGGKLNPNALIKLDPTGEVLYNALMKLPNMTPEIADAIVDWVDPDDNPRPSGAESSDYSPTRAYRAKNGPLELASTSYCSSRASRPNCSTAPTATATARTMMAAAASTAAGSDFLTVHGREVNVDSTGMLRIWVNHNSDDLNAIYKAMLDGGIDQEMAAYIIAAKIYTRTQLDANGNPIQSGGGKAAAREAGRVAAQAQKVRVGGANDLIAAVEKSLSDPASLARKRSLPSWTWSTPA